MLVSERASRWVPMNLIFNFLLIYCFVFTEPTDSTTAFMQTCKNRNDRDNEKGGERVQRRLKEYLEKKTLFHEIIKWNYKIE